MRSYIVYLYYKLYHRLTGTNGDQIARSIYQDVANGTHCIGKLAYLTQEDWQYVQGGLI
jgi:hypothetical protein